MDKHLRVSDSRHSGFAMRIGLEFGFILKDLRVLDSRHSGFAMRICLEFGFILKNDISQS